MRAPIKASVLLARFAAVTTHRHDALRDIAAAEAAMAEAGFSYPLVAKPDIGCNDTGVRLITDAAGLSRYLAAFPRGERVLLQQYIKHDGEAGLFYGRHPDQAHGALTSNTLK